MAHPHIRVGTPTSVRPPGHRPSCPHSLSHHTLLHAAHAAGEVAPATPTGLLASSINWLAEAEVPGGAMLLEVLKAPAPQVRICMHVCCCACAALSARRAGAAEVVGPVPCRAVCEQRRRAAGVAGASNTAGTVDPGLGKSGRQQCAHVQQFCSFAAQCLQRAINCEYSHT